MSSKSHTDSAVTRHWAIISADLLTPRARATKWDSAVYLTCPVEIPAWFSYRSVRTSFLRNTHLLSLVIPLIWDSASGQVVWQKLASPDVSARTERMKYIEIISDYTARADSALCFSAFYHIPLCFSTGRSVRTSFPYANMYAATVSALLPVVEAHTYARSRTAM